MRCSFRFNLNKEGKGAAFEIFIYRVPYPRALKVNIEFSIVCSYLRKIIRQFRSMPCIITMDLVYFSKEGIENRW